MKSLTAGFDVVTRHLGLILFSIGLDLLLWFGPQIRLIRLVEPFLNQINSIPEIQESGSVELLAEGFQRLNLFSILSTFPIGIPSMMALRAPVDNPIGLQPLTIVLSSSGITILLWIGLTLAGIGFGTLYFTLISQACLFDSLNIRTALSQWLRNFAYILLLSLFWVISLMLFLLPMSCLMSISLLLGFGTGQYPLWMAIFSAAVIVWFIIPLFFSPHGIISSHKTVQSAILQSIRISRSTFGPTTLLIILIGLISQGLNVLWNRPTEDSWFLLVGVLGHAFVSAGLISATFIYYSEVELWLKHLTERKQAKTA